MNALLKDIRIATPCAADWDDMTPTGERGARRCADCDEDVFDLSALTRAEAVALLERRTGRRLPCVRLYQRWDGTVLTADCPVGIPRAARRRRLDRWAAAAAALGLVGAMTGCSTPTMGEVQGCGGPPPVVLRHAPIQLDEELHDLVPAHELLERPKATPRRLPTAR